MSIKMTQNSEWTIFATPLSNQPASFRQCLRVRPVVIYLQSGARYLLLHRIYYIARPSMQLDWQVFATLLKTLWWILLQLTNHNGKFVGGGVFNLHAWFTTNTAPRQLSVFWLAIGKRNQHKVVKKPSNIIRFFVLWGRHKAPRTGETALLLIRHNTTPILWM